MEVLVGVKVGVTVAGSVGVTMGGFREGDWLGGKVADEVIVAAWVEVAAGRGRLPSASESEKPPNSNPAEISAVTIPQITWRRFRILFHNFRLEQDWQNYAEGRTGACLRFHPDAAALCFGERLGNGKPHTGITQPLDE